MTKRIMTTILGRHYITFGDKECKYVLIESADELCATKHHFELHLKGSPTDVFARFDYTCANAIENSSIKDIFGSGVTQAQNVMREKIEQFEKDCPGGAAVSANMKHLLKCLEELDDALWRFDRR